MLTLNEQRALASWEDRWLEPPEEEENSDNEIWLRADDEAEERWIERNL